MLIFFFNDTATTEIYTLSLHDALPISRLVRGRGDRDVQAPRGPAPVELAELLDGEHPAQAPAQLGDDRVDHAIERAAQVGGDRKSTRLNSRHANISYAVFCLKKKTSLY